MSDKIGTGRRIKAVIFDMDGVLVDSEVFFMEHMRIFYRLNGIELPEDMLHELVGGTMEIYWDALEPYSPGTWDFGFFRKAYGEFCATIDFSYKDFLSEGTVEVLSALEKKGYKIGLASSSSIRSIRRALSECRIEQYFTSILSGDMFTKSKPDPEIYLKSAEALGLQTDECIVVEDSYYGIEAGKRAGMTVIAKRDTRFGTDQSKADYFINSLKDILSLLEKIN